MRNTNIINMKRNKAIAMVKVMPIIVAVDVAWAFTRPIQRRTGGGYREKLIKCKSMHAVTCREDCFTPVHLQLSATSNGQFLDTDNSYCSYEIQYGVKLLFYEALPRNKPIIYEISVLISPRKKRTDSCCMSSGKSFDFP